MYGDLITKILPGISNLAFRLRIIRENRIEFFLLK